MFEPANRLAEGTASARACKPASEGDDLSLSRIMTPSQLDAGSGEESRTALRGNVLMATAPPDDILGRGPAKTITHYRYGGKRNWGNRFSR